MFAGQRVATLHSSDIHDRQGARFHARGDFATGGMRAYRANANAPAARASNMGLLLHTLQRQQPISRVRLARATGISTTTITNLVQELTEEGVVIESGVDQLAARPGAGRPPVALRVAPHSRSAIGVHIGVRRVRIGMVDMQGNLLDLRFVEHDPRTADGRPTTTAEQAIARVGDVIFEMMCAHVDARKPHRLVGIGIGASGLVESREGINLLAPRLGWSNVPLRADLRRHLLQRATDDARPELRTAARNIVVENNVRCMALAESLYGVARGARALAYVYARMGVGAGFVVDGELYRGADFGAGEIGHWVMIPKGGDLCGCGNRGCLETLISEATILARAEEIHPELTVGKSDPLQVVFAAARDGHLALVEMLEERAFYVGLALANIVNALNPQVILLGGWLSEAFDLVEPVIAGVMRQHAFADLGAHVDLLPTSFGAYSGVIGAGVLAIEQFVFSPQP